MAGPGLAAPPAGFGARCRAGLAVLALVALAPGPAAAEPPPDLSACEPVRLGYSARVFPGLNENDAKAAIRLWAQTMGREQQIPVDPETRTLNGNAAIIAAIREGRIDGITLLADEFWAIRGEVDIGPFMFGRRRNQLGEHYVLLVRHEHPATALRDLRDGTLAMMQDSRSALGSIWLETELLAAGLGPLPRFWRRVAEAGSPSKTVLPVFFKQTDACLTTRAAFQTMIELNPQVGRQLRVLAESPELIPSLFCFRAQMDPETRRRLLLAAPRLPETATGRQMLTLFQCDDLVTGSDDTMAASCALLDRHAALKIACGEKGPP